MRELLLAARRRVRDVWMVEDVDDALILTEIVDLAGDLRVPVRRVGRGRLEAEARTDAPQGVLAHAAPLPEADLDDLLRSPNGSGDPKPFLVAVDGVTDPQNLGALMRSALGAGVTGVVLPRHRAANITPTVAKAAAGAVEHLPVAMAPGLPSAMAEMTRAGLWTVGLDGDAETTLYQLSVADEPIALIVGAEGAGLSRLVRQRCDVLASIPLAGPLASLNVSAAAAVACFEIARRRVVGVAR